MRPDDALSHEFRGLVTCRTLYDQGNSRTPAPTFDHERFGPARERVGDLGQWHETKRDLPKLAHLILCGRAMAQQHPLPSAYLSACSRAMPQKKMLPR